MLIFQAFRVSESCNWFISFTTFRGHLQELDLTMRTTGISLSTSIPRGHLWLPMATTCIQPRATHHQCPSMPRGLQHKPQHLSSTHSPSPRGYCAPQVRLFSIVPQGTRFSGSFSCGLSFFLLCHKLCTGSRASLSCLPFTLRLVRVTGTRLTSLWQGETFLSVPLPLVQHHCVFAQLSWTFRTRFLSPFFPPFLWLY